jgi:hypothetical protein
MAPAPRIIMTYLSRGKMKVGRGVHEGLGPSPVLADGFGRVGGGSAGGSLVLSLVGHPWPLAAHETASRPPALLRRVNLRRLQAPPKATPRTGPCVPRRSEATRGTCTRWAAIGVESARPHGW